VPERNTNEDRPVKKCGIEDRVSSEDTSSSGGGGGGKGLGDEVHAPWLLRSDSILDEDGA